MKGYQFWAQADKGGFFVIKSIIPASYNLYAWVPGFIGDYKFDRPIHVRAGSAIKHKNLIFEPPRDGPTLWEIGYANRLASEFFVPAVNPYFVNHLYLNFDKFRQYGLWQEYNSLYPVNDLTYTIGSSNYTRDWFYAHVPRKTENGSLVATTWSVIFQLSNVPMNSSYTLRVALASAAYGRLQVSVNQGMHIYRSKIIGKDNAVARHGIHGLYHLIEVKVSSSRLHEGNNTIYLTQTVTVYDFNGVMYDYVRLEGPSE